MIFVTVGTHQHPFDRLVKEIDKLVGAGVITEKVFMQTGNSDYAPKNCEFEKFVGSDKFERLYAEADTIICHAGAGSIINALKNRKHLIIVPRLKKLNEHNDDHQLDLAKAMELEGKAVCVYDVENLPDAIKTASNSTTPSMSNVLEKRLGSYLDSLEGEK
ncbi:MAG: PssE/Cps14G family polysaccharide biosynthesis glycosyltransferase [Candidatus Aenigmatarchaeota archaeon]